MTGTKARVVLCAMAAAAFGSCGGDGGTSPTPDPSPPPSASCAAGAPVSGIPTLGVRLIASGFSFPLDLQTVAGDLERLYVVEQGGRIRIIRNGQVQAAPFIDISGRLSAGGERGLLGLAFHPGFASNGRFYVNYTNPSGDTHIAEFTADSADTANPATERVLLVVPQPFGNHNGGSVAFGIDSYLYIALGDGGSGGDPLGNGQALDTLLGKILRINVDTGAPYAIPLDNPFLFTPGVQPEIWAHGLRNPYRIAFEPATGNLYIGDVGQGRREEIDIGLASDGGGENYGWNVMEGMDCFSPSSGCERTGLTPPVLDYPHSEGCSVTGGVVYSGCRMPDLVGTYFYGDFCSAFVRSFRFVGGQVEVPRDWSANVGGVDRISSFGTDAEGEAYIVDYDGEIYRLEPAS